MSTDIEYSTEDFNYVDAVDDNPPVMECQIYKDAFSADPEDPDQGLAFRTSEGLTAFGVIKLDVAIVASINPARLRFKWADPEVNPRITATITPAPTQTVDDDGLTEYELPTPPVQFSSYEFTFGTGSPGFTLSVKVKRK